MGCGQSSAKSDGAPTVQPSIDVSKLSHSLKLDDKNADLSTSLHRNESMSSVQSKLTVKSGKIKTTPLSTPRYGKENSDSRLKRHPGIRAAQELDEDRSSHSAPVSASSRSSPSKSNNRILPLNVNKNSPQRPKTPQLSEFNFIFLLTIVFSS